MGRLLRRHWLGVLGALVMLLIVLVALFAPLLAPYNPYTQFADGLTLDGSPLPPSPAHLLGTDLLGRDLLSRLIYGARTSLFVGLLANGLSITVGTALGIIAGYLRGLAGVAIMRFTDLMMAFPGLLLAIALSGYFPALYHRRHCDRAGELGVHRPRHLHRDDVDRRARLRRRGLRPRRPAVAHSRSPHSAASRADHPGVDDARHRDHRAARSDAFLSRDRRAAANSRLGQHHLREPDLFQLGAVARVLPGFAIALLAFSSNLAGDALRDILDPRELGQSR